MKGVQTLSRQADTLDAPPPGPAPGGPLPLSAEELAELPREVLKDEGDRNPLVSRIEAPEGPLVFKTWEPERGGLLRWWADLNQRRERRHYLLLADVPGIPRLHRIGPGNAFAVAFIEGQDLGRQVEAARLAAGLDSFERRLAGMHARRFAHLDLHQKRNVLIDAAGEAWIIDLGQGLDCSRWWCRPLFPLLAWIDRRAIDKFRARYAPQTLDPARRDALVARYGGRRRRPVLLWIRRLLRRYVVGEDPHARD